MNLFNLAKEEKGNVIVELSIVLPLLFLISFAALGLSLQVKYIQLASTISREAVARALRECTYSNKPEQCLKRINEDLTEISDGLAHDSGTILTVYSANQPDDETSCQPAGPITTVSSGNVIVDEIEMESKYFNSEVNAANSDDELKCLIAQNGIVVIAETFMVFRRTIPDLIGIFDDEKGFFYNATTV